MTLYLWIEDTLNLYHGSKQHYFIPKQRPPPRLGLWTTQINTLISNQQNNLHKAISTCFNHKSRTVPKFNTASIKYLPRHNSGIHCSNTQYFKSNLELALKCLSYFSLPFVHKGGGYETCTICVYTQINHTSAKKNNQKMFRFKVAAKNEFSFR